MECPHCKTELKYPEKAWHNAYQYKSPCNVATDCCGKAIRVIPRFSVEVVAAFNVGETDDWGQEYS